MFSRLHTRFAKSLTCASIFATLFMIAERASAQFTAGRLVVERVGTGSALTSAAAAIFADEYNPATVGGTATYTVAIPTSTSGSLNQATASGTATSEGFLTVSANGKYLVVPGYDAPVGTAGVGSAAVNRVVTRIDPFGTLASTVATNATTFTSTNYRGVASTDGLSYYMGGNGSATTGGLRYVAHQGSTSAVASTQVAVVSSTGNGRIPYVYGSSLYISTGAGTTGVYSVTGLPTTGTVTATSVAAAVDPYAFVIVNNGGTNVMYVQNNSNRLINKFYQNAGVWTAAGAYTPAVGYYGITASVSGSTVKLYCANNTTIATFNDASVGTATISGVPTATVLATAATNTIFRGITFAPFTASVSGNATVCNGSSATITFTGTPSAVITYSINGTVQTTVSIPAGGTYTVSTGAISSNQTYALASVTDGNIVQTVGTSVTVTVNPIPTGVSATALPSPICSGSNLTLTGNATGAATYAWSGPAGSGYTSTAQNPTAFAATTANSGVYTFVATATGGCSVTVTTSAVTVNPTPAPTLSPATASFSTGSSQVLTFTGNVGDVITYTWTGGGPATTTIGAGGTSTVNVTPTPAGSYTYAITSATSAASCTNASPTGSIQSVLSVSDLPIASIAGSTAICEDGSADLVFTGTPSATVTYGDGVTPGLTTTLDGTGSSTVTVTPPVGVNTYTLTSVTSGTVTASASGSAAVTVNPTPSAISGTLSVCVGSSVTLTDAFSGTWSSPDATVFVVAGSGSVTGLSAGTATIIFTSTATCTTSAVIAINSLPTVSSISGATSVCAGSNITLSDVDAGGVWSSTSGNATVDGSGTVHGVTAGTTTISYTITSAGCSAAAQQVVTINALTTAGTINGATTVYVGSTVTLTDNTGTVTGTWSSTNNAVGSVGSTTGIVAGITTGTTTISYTVVGVCGTVAATVNITVLPVPPMTVGNIVVEVLGDGVQTLANVGNSIFVKEYNPSTNAQVRTVAVTDNGTNGLIETGSGTSAGLLNRSSNGKWMSVAGYNIALGGTTSITGVAGVARGVGKVDAFGNYTFVKKDVNFYVNNNLRSTVSDGNTFYWTGGTPGGTNVFVDGGSDAVGVQTVTSNTRAIEIYNGNLYYTTSSGTAGVSGIYMINGGLVTTANNSVTQIIQTTAGSGTNSPYAFAFNPTGTICYVADDRSAATGGGVQKWVSPTGAAGTYTLAYTYNSFDGTSGARGLTADFSGSNPVVYATSAPGTTGANKLVKIIDFGSVGTSSVTTIATAPSNQVFRGVSLAPFSASVSGGAAFCGTGSSTITFTGSPSAVITYSINGTVQPTVSIPASGTYTVSTGTITSSATYALASVTDGTIVQTIGSSVTVTINPVPAPTLSPATASVATGSSQDLVFSGNVGDVVTYSWTGGGPATTTIGAGGTSTISPTFPTIGSYTYAITSATSAAGCVNATPTGSITSVLTVADVPFATISGGTNYCNDGVASANLVFTGNAGATVTYGDGTTPGLTVLMSGTLGSGAGSATVNVMPAAGITTYTLTSVTSGTVTTTVSGSTSVTVNPMPSAVGGILTVCVGSSTTLTDAFAGTWSSASGNVSVVGSTGAVTGVSAGTATVVFTSNAGCTASADVTVNAVPTVAAISGASSVCVGSTITLSDATASGVWSSTAGTASIDGSGNVLGVSAGSTTISYTVTNGFGCIAAATMNVSAVILPTVSAITGTTTIFSTGFTNLTDATTGGVWSSTNTGAATVGSTGHVSGVSAGTTTISYTLNNACGTVAATVNVTVNAAPSAFTRGNLVAYRVGDGTAPLSSVGTTGQLIEFATNGTPTGFAIQMPTTGTYSFVTSGSATSEAMISLSAENDRLIVGGYNAPVGTTGIAGTTAAAAPRQLVAAYANGTLSRVATTSTLFSGNNIRGGTASGNNYYAAGASNGVVAFVGTVTTTVTSGLSNTRFPQILNGQLYVSSSSGSFTNVSKVGTGIPTTASTLTTLNVTTSGTGGTSPYGYSFSPDNNTLFVADDAKGVSKYVLASGGLYTIAYTFPISTAARGMVVDYSGSNPVIYATTSATTNAIVAFTDPGTVGGAAAVVVTTLAVAPANTAYRGLMFAPSCYASVSTLSPAFCAGGNGQVVFTGNPTGTVSYNVDGGSTATTTLDAFGSSTVTLTSLSSSCTVNLMYINTAGCSSVTVTGSTVVTVNPLPSVAGISGASYVCVGSTTTLSDATSSGVWSSTSINASVNASGVVTGNSAGTATISYLVTNGFGCSFAATYPFTVNALPSVAGISGASSVCIGGTTTLTDATASGVWSSASSNASINASGVVTGNTAGTTTISYLVTDGFGCSATATTTVTVNALPTVSSFGGGVVVCAGDNVTLNAAGAVAYVWTGGVTDGELFTPSVGVNSYTVTGTDANGCSNTATTTITVNTTPSAGTITGTATVCTGFTTNLTDAVAGGTWSSTSPTIGSVDASGVVTGLAVGTTTISYTVATGCGTVAATSVVTVNLSPDAGSITGTATVCAGSTTNLTDATVGGTWSSSTLSVGTVDASGVVSGISAGTTTVSYTVTTACGSVSTTSVVTVNPLPVAGTITGTATVCTGFTTNLTDAVTGGTWSSTSPTIGSVDASGVVTGLALGTTTISYTVTNGCGTVAATKDVTVNLTPDAGTITGTSSVCVGSTTNLTDAAVGGVWSSSAPTIGSVSTSGVVRGLAAGTTTISYSVSNSCGTVRATSVVTVNTTATGTITGPVSVAVGADITLTDAVAGGVWTASNARATVTGGLVHGVSNGTVTISYTVTDACGTAAATKIITVGTVTVTVAAITGYNFYLCQNATAPFFDATAGGVWSIDPSGSSIASVSATGVVTGLSAGTTTLSYSVGASSATHVLTVYPVPAAIAGTPSVCQGFTTALTDVTPGGVWTSGIPSTATVGTSGIVTATNTGIVPIYYTLTLPAGCRSTVMVTINPNPAGISGASSVCVGSSVALSDVTAGGSWSSPSSLISVSGSGSVTGISVGTGTISYTLATGCYRVFNVTVKATPVAISGNTTVCIGATTALTDATTGALSWSSGTPSVATVNAAGVVSGLAAGTSNITYTLTSGCTAIATVTVTAQPAAITNNSAFCQGSSITLSDATGGGTWSSGNLAVGTVDASSGAVAGIAPGSATITYALAGSGCRATAVITVNASTSAGSISGTQTVCAGSTTPLSSASVPGGTWSSTATTIATVNAFGVVSGLTAGTATISYTITNICGTTASSVVVTVNPLPVAGTITGTGTVCAGSTTSLTDASAGGVWTTSNALVATVGSDGTVTGVAGGTARITYAVTNSCGNSIATSIVTVNALTAGTISGASSVIAGLTITLSDAVMGGVWSATNANATVSSVGVVTGVTPGTVTISYTVANGCGTIAATQLITVTASSTSGILGTLSVCNGMTTALTDLTPGGTWQSSNTMVATVGTSGIVTGAASGTGTATISYTVGGVPATVVVTLNPNPSSIGGATSVCNGSSITLSDLTIGGTWTSTSGVSVTTGTTVTTVTGTSVGTSIVSYTLATGCYKTYNVTVKSLPTAILGNLNVCGVGNVTFLSDVTAGTSWTIAPATVATISPSGRVYGASIGTATVTYNAANSCIITAVATVNALVTVAPILGATNVGHGLTITLSDATASGVWSSSNAALGSVDAVGNVTGVGTSGTVTISYSVSYAGGGCTAYATKPITVHTPAPHSSSVSGTVSITAGSVASLNDEVASGIWSSSNTGVATVDGGIVTAIAPGITNITHTVANSEGDVTTTVTPVIVNIAAGDVRIIPNPNAGAFSIKGTLGATNDQEVTFEVTDMLGQVIYKNNVIAINGKISESISLNGTLANGMYMLNMHTSNESKVFHFVIEK